MIGYKITIPMTSGAHPHSLEYNSHELRLCIGFLNAMQDGILQSGEEDYWLRQAVYFAHKCENALIREAEKCIKKFKVPHMHSYNEEGAAHLK